MDDPLDLWARLLEAAARGYIEAHALPDDADPERYGRWLIRQGPGLPRQAFSVSVPFDDLFEAALALRETAWLKEQRQRDKQGLQSATEFHRATRANRRKGPRAAGDNRTAKRVSDWAPWRRIWWKLQADGRGPDQARGDVADQMERDTGWRPSRRTLLRNLK